MNKPLVSILMSCYNGARFIDRSFKSILAQTWPNIELVFVNDGSRDNSLSIAQNYRDAFEKRGYLFTLIDQENTGFPVALYNASKKAKGVFIQFLDVDDVIMPESCRLQAEFLLQNADCNVVRTNGIIVDEEKWESNDGKILVGENESRGIRNIFNDLVLARTNNYAGAYMMRAKPVREYYSTHSFFVTRYGQNLQFLLPLTQKAPVGFIDLPLFKYIRYEGSHSNQPSYEKQMENLNGYWAIRRHLIEELNADSELIKACEIAYCQRAMYIALTSKRFDEYKTSYDNIKKLGGLTLELRNENAVVCNKKLLHYIYTILLRLDNMFIRTFFY